MNVINVVSVLVEIYPVSKARQRNVSYAKNCYQWGKGKSEGTEETTAPWPHAVGFYYPQKRGVSLQQSLYYALAIEGATQRYVRRQIEVDIVREVARQLYAI